MAKGISQEQVNNAADLLMAAGENPTVEKVRNALGTGSPNTVLRMLDAWRNQLAARLQRVIELPNLPPELGQAVADLWQAALIHASRLSKAELEAERNALLIARAEIEQERTAWQASIVHAEQQVSEFEQKAVLSATQAAERQVHVEELTRQREDLLRQRDLLETQASQLALERSAFEAERRTSHEHMLAQEDRFHRLIDDARQELKQLKHQWELEQRSQAAAIARHEAVEDQLKLHIREAEQLATRHAGRVEALEATLAQMMSAKRRAPARKQTAEQGKQKAKGAPRRRSRA